MSTFEPYDAAMHVLQKHMASLHIRGVNRKVKRMRYPDQGLVYEFSQLADDIMMMNTESFSEQQRNSISFFGTEPTTIARLWELILENNDGVLKEGAKREHLLWALHYLKQYPNFKVMRKTMKKKKVDKLVAQNTMTKWVWYFIYELRDLEHVVILWENRLTNDRGNDCLVSVDCTDCPFPQCLLKKDGKKIVNKALYTCKLHGPGLRYEIAFSILTNDIVWINGPFLPGKFNDITIFKFSLIHKLEDGERVEADDAYVSESPQFVVCPASMSSREEEESCSKRIQGRHEILNNHLKFWTCLKKPFVGKGTTEEKIEKHGAMFRACAVVKQVSMELGCSELYDVGDNYTNY